MKGELGVSSPESTASEGLTQSRDAGRFASYSGKTGVTNAKGAKNAKVKIKSALIQLRLD